MQADIDHLSTYLLDLLGDEFDAFCAAGPEPPSIRINPLRTTHARLLARLADWNISHIPHPVNPDGLILPHDELPLSHTLAYFTGDFFYQGISSQLPVLALDPQPGETILDLCAAPGAKTTQIAALMKNRGRLLINDVSNRRMQPLMANLQRAGVINDVVINMPGQMLGRLLPEYFDRVLVDAPCSALSMLPQRLDQTFWSAAYLQKISQVQEHLLISAIKAARVGGTIVYSTCSICPEENEMVLDRVLRRYPVSTEPLPFADADFMREPYQVYQGHGFHQDVRHAIRIHPYPQPCEGFFVARLRKTGPLTVRPVNNALSFAKTLTSQDDAVEHLLDHLQTRWGIPYEAMADFRFILKVKRLWMVAPQWEAVPERSFMMAGIPLAIRKSESWKLSDASVQWFGDQITQSRLQMDREALLALFQDGRIPAPESRLQYHVLAVDGRNIAIMSQAEGFYKIHLPHHFKLVF